MHTTSETVSDALDLIRTRLAGALIAYPDSGHFEMPDWRFVDTISPSRLHDYFNEWIGPGAQVLGGCCGLTVEHIEAAWQAARTPDRFRPYRSRNFGSTGERRRYRCPTLVSLLPLGR